MLTIPVSEVAGLCYGEGWRDKNLITIVAIAGAESGFSTDFTDTEKFGLFGLKAHNLSIEPEKLFDPLFSTKIARELYEDRYFNPWICWAMRKHLKYVRQSID